VFGWQLSMNSTARLLPFSATRLPTILVFNTQMWNLRNQPFVPTIFLWQDRLGPQPTNHSLSRSSFKTTIEVSNTWGDDVISNIFTRYDETSLKNTCHEMTQVTKTSTSRYAISCISLAPVGHVDIFVTDDSFNEFDNNAKVP
jgi:hypothetical protein